MNVARRWKFRPGLLPTLATLIIIPVMIALGQWQLDRAAEKKRSHEQFQQRRALSVLRLNAGDPEIWKYSVMKYRPIEIRGRYDAGMHVLLDNQVLNGSVGYVVYTPFLLEGEEAYILVNRGWLPADPDRTRPPEFETPPGVLSLAGVARQPPPPGIKMGDNTPEQLAADIVRLQRIEMEQMMQEYSGKLIPYELRLDPAAPTGFTRSWSEPGSGHDRHVGYAFQWFAMAAAVGLLYLLLNLRREERQA